MAKYIVTSHITSGPQVGSVVEWDDKEAAQIPWALQPVLAEATQGAGTGVEMAAVEAPANGTEAEISSNSAIAPADMTVASLKQALAALDLPTSGKKAALVARLTEATQGAE